MAEENIPLSNLSNQSKEKMPKRYLQTISQWDPDTCDISFGTTTLAQGKETSSVKKEDLIKILNSHYDKRKQNKHMKSIEEDDNESYIFEECESSFALSAAALGDFEMLDCCFKLGRNNQRVHIFETNSKTVEHKIDIKDSNESETNLFKLDVVTKTSHETILHLVFRRPTLAFKPFDPHNKMQYINYMKCANMLFDSNDGSSRKNKSTFNEVKSDSDYKFHRNKSLFF